MSTLSLWIQLLIYQLIMLTPNYNFENEIEASYGVIALRYRTIANTLLHKYKIINQKEHDVIMWQACNLPAGSILRVSLLSNLLEWELAEKVKDVPNLQSKLNL